MTETRGPASSRTPHRPRPPGRLLPDQEELMMPEQTLPLVPHNGMTLLRTVATAVLDLSDVPNPGTFTLPYPAEAQRALDRTVLACLLRGAEPPRRVPGLLVSCREIPVVDWPL